MRKYSFLVLIPFLFYFFTFTTYAQNETDLRLHARSAILVDADSGRVLYEENAYAKMPMASTTKIMTCILALEAENGGGVVKVSKEATRQPKVKLYLKEGEEYLLNDLLYSLMLESHNDTAVAIAEYLAGSVKNFADMMNKKAVEIGCKDTYFITPNGLDSSDNGKLHSSTAADMAKIASYALKNERFCEIIQTSDYTFATTDGKKIHHVYNKDGFLHQYDGAYGVKTGFTGKAGYCFVGAAKRGNRNLVSVVLACGWPPNKTWKWADTKTLMNYGMDNYDKCEITIKQQYVDLPVKNGLQPFIGISKENRMIELLLSSNDDIVVKKEIISYMEAPVKKGECVGYEIYYVNGEEWDRLEVYTTEAVEERQFKHFLLLVIKKCLLS